MRDPPMGPLPSPGKPSSMKTDCSGDLHSSPQFDPVQDPPTSSKLDRVIAGSTHGNSKEDQMHSLCPDEFHSRSNSSEGLQSSFHFGLVEDPTISFVPDRVVAGTTDGDINEDLTYSLFPEEFCFEDSPHLNSIIANPSASDAMVQNPIDGVSVPFESKTNVAGRLHDDTEDIAMYSLFPDKLGPEDPAADFDISPASISSSDTIVLTPDEVAEEIEQYLWNMRLGSNDAARTLGTEGAQTVEIQTFRSNKGQAMNQNGSYRPQKVRGTLTVARNATDRKPGAAAGSQDGRLQETSPRIWQAFETPKGTGHIETQHARKGKQKALCAETKAASPTTTQANAPRRKWENPASAHAEHSARKATRKAQIEASQLPKYSSRSGQNSSSRFLCGASNTEVQAATDTADQKSTVQSIGAAGVARQREAVREREEQDQVLAGPEAAEYHLHEEPFDQTQIHDFAHRELANNGIPILGVNSYPRGWRGVERRTCPMGIRPVSMGIPRLEPASEVAGAIPYYPGIYPVRVEAPQQPVYTSAPIGDGVAPLFPSLRQALILDDRRSDQHVYGPTVSVRHRPATGGASEPTPDVRLRGGGNDSSDSSTSSDSSDDQSADDDQAIPPPAYATSYPAQSTHTYRPSPGHETIYDNPEQGIYTYWPPARGSVRLLAERAAAGSTQSNGHIRPRGGGDPRNMVYIPGAAMRQAHEGNNRAASQSTEQAVSLRTASRPTGAVNEQSTQPVDGPFAAQAGSSGGGRPQAQPVIRPSAAQAGSSGYRRPPAHSAAFAQLDRLSSSLFGVSRQLHVMATLPRNAGHAAASFPVFSGNLLSISQQLSATIGTLISLASGPPPATDAIARAEARFSRVVDALTQEVTALVSMSNQLSTMSYAQPSTSASTLRGMSAELARISTHLKTNPAEPASAPQDAPSLRSLKTLEREWHAANRAETRRRAQYLVQMTTIQEQVQSTWVAEQQAEQERQARWRARTEELRRRWEEAWATGHPDANAGGGGREMLLMDEMARRPEEIRVEAERRMEEEQQQRRRQRQLEEDEQLQLEWEQEDEAQQQWEWEQEEEAQQAEAEQQQWEREQEDEALQEKYQQQQLEWEQEGKAQ